MNQGIPDDLKRADELPLDIEGALSHLEGRLDMLQEELERLREYIDKIRELV